MVEWLDIKSAPKDGTHILVFVPDEVLDYQLVAAYDKSTGWSDTSRGSYWGFKPTHWLPLPNPPKQTPENVSNIWDRR